MTALSSQPSALRRAVLKMKLLAVHEISIVVSLGLTADR